MKIACLYRTINKISLSREILFKLHKKDNETELCFKCQCILEY